MDNVIFDIYNNLKKLDDHKLKIMIIEELAKSKIREYLNEHFESLNIPYVGRGIFTDEPNEKVYVLSIERSTENLSYIQDEYSDGWQDLTYWVDDEGNKKGEPNDAKYFTSKFFVIEFLIENKSYLDLFFVEEEKIG